MKRFFTYSGTVLAGSALGASLCCALMDPNPSRGVACGLTAFVGGAVFGVGTKIAEHYRGRDFGELSLYDLPTEEIVDGSRKQYP